MKKIKFKISWTSTGYCSYTEKKEMILAVTTGGNLAGLKANCLEAYNLYLEEKEKPAITADNLAYEFDIPSFFEFYKEINASALGKRIGMHKSLLSEYVNGKRQPSEKQAEKVLQGIRDLGKELSDIGVTA